MSFGPGTVFKHYRIERLIGKGGMGEVYLAEETTLGRKVAIKVLKQEATADPKFVERFRNEARMLGQLNHPNIVGLYSFFEDGGTYYLVMQYAPGITLAELIRRTGPIPEQRAMRIFAQLAEALTFAHGEGIVHRDIKPSNIMVDPEKNDRVLVMDFGIARMMDSQHITRTGAQVGTPCYMSPEQVLGKRDIGPASDVYSSGVLLYEMLAGSLPYDMEVDSLYTIQDRIIKEPLPDPRLCYEYISERGVALVIALTHKDPDKRPQSIAEALRDNVAEQAVPVQRQADPVPHEKAKGIITRDPVAIKDDPVPGSIDTLAVPSDGKRGRIATIIAILSILAFVVVMVMLATRNKDGRLRPTSAPEMIRVEGGTFLMGSNDGKDDEKPVHQVTISSFYIGKYEVTQKEWVDVMGYNRTGTNSYAKHPARITSWYEVLEYCNMRSYKEGLTPVYKIDKSIIDKSNISIADKLKWTVDCDWNANGYRLPTEAEWEFAARGGIKSNGNKYSGSNDVVDVAWFSSNAGGTSQAVGVKSPNELGIYDMSGNVWEWCWDWYGKYAESESHDPKGVSGGYFRILRGGSWESIDSSCRVSSRNREFPNQRGSLNGLRVVRSAL